jgi:hypothetical protein
MSNSNFCQAENFALSLILIAVLSAFFGYTVGKSDREKHLNNQESIPEIQQDRQN